MRILHVGDIAGVPQYLAWGQRKLGHDSRNISFYRTGVGRPLDFYIDLGYGRLEAFVNRLYFLKFIRKYDVFHFHFRSVIPNGLDLLLWKLLGKTVVIHHHGTDVRWLGEPYLYRKYADHIFVCTPDLLEWTPTAEWLPNPINVGDLPNVGQVNDTPKVVHAASFVPTRKGVKGTIHVERAVEQLRKEGVNFEFELIRGKLFSEAMEIYEKSDIVIDWINPLYGICSMVAIENMALGKPVITCIRDDLMEKYYGDLPIVNAYPREVAEKLKLLLDDYEYRRELGQKGREYVERVNHNVKLAERTIEVYEEAEK